jgi:hypothetical protein
MLGLGVLGFRSMSGFVCMRVRAWGARGFHSARLQVVVHGAHGAQHELKGVAGLDHMGMRVRQRVGVAESRNSAVEGHGGAARWGSTVGKGGLPSRLYKVAPVGSHFTGVCAGRAGRSKVRACVRACVRAFGARTCVRAWAAAGGWR